MYKKFLLLIFAGISILSACTEPEIDYYGSISGVVKDALTNELLVGVRATISPGGESQMTADDGTFYFNDLESNEYTISFSKEGYIPDSQKVKVKPGNDASVQIVMTKVPETKGNIVGVVKDSKTGYLLEGVQISVSPGGVSMVTGADGVFRFDKLEAKEYLLVFAKGGYEGVSQQVNVKAGTDVSVQVIMNTVPETKGNIVGIVKDSKTGYLLEGVQISVSPGGVSMVTGADGVFRFDKLEAKEYLLAFAKEGYEGLSQQVSVKGGSDVSVQIAMTQIPETKGSIVGIVKDSQTGSLIGGVQVSVSPGGASMITGVDGLFRFDKLEAQEYLVVFSKDGYEGASQQVNVKAGTDVSVQVVMTPIQPKLSVSTKALSFGNDTQTLSIDITNTGKGTLEWEVNEKVEWIECTPMSGKTTNQTSTVVVTVIKDKLDQGNYNDSFVISSNGGSETILVSTSVNGITLEVEPSELDFGTIVTSQGITLTNTATGTLLYEVSTSNNWITLSKSSGNISKTDNLTVIVSREGLSASKYDGNIIFSTRNGLVSIPVKMEVAVDEKPTVTAESISDITYNSAILHGTVVSAGSDKITRYGFCWSENQNPTIEDFYSNLGDCKEPRSFESAITNLKSETKYYFRAYAENNVGLTYSEKTLSFSTEGLPMPPSVTTGAISDISSKSATAKGNITSLGNVKTILNYGHVWSETPEPTIVTGNRSELGKATETASFTSEISGLDVATTYYIRAYATNEKGTSYGEEVSFKTMTENPVVKTGGVTDIVHNAATCSGTISYTGGNSIIEKGICWATSAQPKISNSHIASTDNGITFKCRITGLSNETQYYARAYIKTAMNDIFYGSDVTFTTTKEINFATLKEVSVSNITISSASLECAILSDGNSKITECGFCWSDISEPTIADNVSKCDPESYTMGKTITNLKEGTKYYVKAYARNAMGISYSSTFEFVTTAMTKPVIEHLAVSNIGRNSARVSATITDSGHSRITEAGFCWSTSANPTTYDNKTSVSLGSSTGAESEIALKSDLSGLPEKTTIYVRSFAVNSKGTGYSENYSFETTGQDLLIWDGTIADKFGGGTGTESDPIIISSASQLALLASRVNSGTTFAGVHFILTNSISLENIKWTPIGNYSSSFKGVLEGNNMTISNLNTTFGLFGNNGGTIRNLTVKGKSNYPNGDAGGLCNYNTGLISSCISYMDVESDGDAGGICRYTSGSIKNCTNYGRIKATGKCGGIAGEVSPVTTISSCSNYGNIETSGDYCGGITGYIRIFRTDYYDGKIISYCDNSGEVKGTYAGGIVGYVTVENSSLCKENQIYSCCNLGNIDGTSCSGGLIGRLDIQDKDSKYVFNINNCVNFGRISNNAGGIIGTIDYHRVKYVGTIYIYIKNCCNNSDNGLVYSSSRGNYFNLIFSTSYWLYDIVNNIGQENAICTESGAGSYFTRSSKGCYVRGDTTQDVVELLNAWVDQNNKNQEYKQWKYKIIDGYAYPSLDME